MPKRPTDLEAIVSVLEALEYGERWEEYIQRGDAKLHKVECRRCPLCAAPPPNHTPECVVPGALSIAKRLRDAAVEGWVPEVAKGPWSTWFSRGRLYPTDRHCLLIPLAADPEKPDAD